MRLVLYEGRRIIIFPNLSYIMIPKYNTQIDVKYYWQMREKKAIETLLISWKRKRPSENYTH